MHEFILTRHLDGVTTLTMNDPRRLNGWTTEMVAALHAALERAAADDATKVVVLTGTDPYYSAGVNLGGSVKLGHPRELHANIVRLNAALFDAFISFPKPILIAANGPMIGACTTTASLCNAVVASERATFSTPFAALGVPPEGCSSEVFPIVLGAAAERMLGPEGWKPTAKEALEIGLVQYVVPHDQLLTEAQRIAQEWIRDGVGRVYPAGFGREALQAINERESLEIATAFLSPPFLMGQYRFLRSKKKYGPAAMFLALRVTHPAWSRLI
jgi:peroxisomal 3,2-trans-enoyl-CoA isomerase